MLAYTLYFLFLRSLPTLARYSWAQSNPNHTLFKRGEDFPTVGSSEWSQGFPNPSAPSAVADIPSNWKSALDKAVSDGRIPNIPVAKSTGGNPTYPSGYNPGGKEVCSATYKCRLGRDIWDAPDGVFASSFDDGPLPPTSQLLDFLNENDITTTHFLIGRSILQNVAQFREILDSENDIAVHTFSHPYMTTLSNEAVVGELGWTMMLIYISTEGKLPKYWRPPYGDTDSRVSAIAREVFGMTTVLWNQDTADWAISSGGTTEEEVDASLYRWISGSKTPGLIPLEHELTPATVDAFVDAFPNIESNGWKFASLADAFESSPYQNDGDVLALFGDATPTSTSTSSTTSTSATTSTTSTTSSPTPTTPATTQAAETEAPPSPETITNFSLRNVPFSYPLSVTSALISAFFIFMS